MNLVEKMWEMRELKEKGICPECRCKDPDKKGFKDELSKKEFRISGLCQKCQDETFVEEE